MSSHAVTATVSSHPVTDSLSVVRIVDLCAAIGAVSNKQSRHTYAHLSGKRTTVLHRRPTSSVRTNLQRPETAISAIMYMRYDTETYSLELEIVFTFRNDPSLSCRFKLPHGLSSAEACGVLFSLKCAGCTAMRKSELFISL